MNRKRKNVKIHQQSNGSSKNPEMNEPDQQQNNTKRSRSQPSSLQPVTNGPSVKQRGGATKSAQPHSANGSTPHLDGKGQPKDGHLKNGHSKHGTGLVPHHFLPKFLADNEYLLNHNRPELKSFIKCFKSMFSLHTETWNIWTHLGGSILFVLLSIYYLFHSVSWEQRFTFLVFFFGAITCLGCSGIYHTVLCHSEPVYKLFSKLDYCGVILLIVTSWAPWLHYAFYCSLASKVFYTGLVGILGSASVVVILNDGFSGKEYRPLRAGLFVALGLTGVVPGVHYAWVHGAGVVSAQLHMYIWLILMAIIYILGAVIYAMRIPERFYPGKFDIWFQSHQIMHVCVVMAALFCYHGASMLADYRIHGPSDCVGAIPGSDKLVGFDHVEN